MIFCLMDKLNLCVFVADVFMMEWLTQLLLVLLLMKFSNTLPDVIRIGKNIWLLFLSGFKHG